MQDKASPSPDAFSCLPFGLPFPNSGAWDGQNEDVPLRNNNLPFHMTVKGKLNEEL
jgi:hypothetical protein